MRGAFAVASIKSFITAAIDIGSLTLRRIMWAESLQMRCLNVFWGVCIEHGG
jgi:hypothetical protein